jgi:hypothetical protein
MINELKTMQKKFGDLDVYYFESELEQHLKPKINKTTKKLGWNGHASIDDTGIRIIEINEK